MPELPEVETMVRGIRPAVQGRRIASLRRSRCACRPISMAPAFPQMAGRASGQTITSVRRLGKRVVLDLSSREAFVIEPRMTGLVLLSDPPDRRHLRLQWRFDDEQAPQSLWFWDRRGLGTLRLCGPEELDQLYGPQALGPDALALSRRDWRERCARTSRPIKVALLDQKLVAGIGNLYASEILHRARIHPAQPARELTPDQIRRLAAAVREVLNEAIVHEGSTLSDGTYRNALNGAGRYQNMHRVYMRRDEPCRTCGGGPVQRIVQAQRSTFFCPKCQKAVGSKQ